VAVMELPLPSFYNPARVGEIWRMPYQDRAEDARKWRAEHRIHTSSRDGFRVCLVLIDVQNTFCIPGFELYVGGNTGSGAVDDNRRLVQFLYANLPSITQICPTLDTHQAAQIFHSIFLVDENGHHPEPYTLITVDDIKRGVWRFNGRLAEALEIDETYGQAYLRYYSEQLKAGGKYDLTIWPYHAMLGGIGHALVPSLEEAIFFHTICRFSQPDFQIKGNQPLTENYSVLKPEIIRGLDDKEIAGKNRPFIQKLMSYDAVIIAGQAKSHCVAWTVADLLTEIKRIDPSLAAKIYLLEDCTSPVVIPGVIDYSEQADSAFQGFSGIGIRLERTALSGFPKRNR